MAHGRFERTIGQKCTLFANYVPNVLRHGVLRDPNHSLRIEYTLQWFSKLGPSKRAVWCPNRSKLSYSSVTYAQKSMYVKKASEIKMDQSGRTAMSVDQAASHHYVDDMVSTDTLEMGADNY